MCVLGSKAGPRVGAGESNGPTVGELAHEVEHRADEAQVLHHELGAPPRDAGYDAPRQVLQQCRERCNEVLPARAVREGLVAHLAPPIGWWVIACRVRALFILQMRYSNPVLHYSRCCCMPKRV